MSELDYIGGSILGINGLNFMEPTHPLYIVCKTCV